MGNGNTEKSAVGSNAMKIIGIMAAIIVSLSSAYVAVIVSHINEKIEAVDTKYEDLKDEEISSLLEQVHDLQMELNGASYDKASLLDKLDELEEDIEKLEEKIR